MAYHLVHFLFMLLLPMISADPDAVQDFCVADTSSSAISMNGFPCLNPNEVSAKHFTTSILSSPGNTSDNPFGASFTPTTAQFLPGINTMGVLMARIDIASGGVVPPHIQPRATEIIFVLQGTVSVGFLDTTNKLFSAEIKTGDVFVIPKATIHYIQNTGKTLASVIAALNSQGPGISMIPLATFASDPPIPNEILAKTFVINATEVDEIRKSLGGK